MQLLVGTARASRISATAIIEELAAEGLLREPLADDHGDPKELLAKLDEAEKQAAAPRGQLKSMLAEALLR